MSGRGKRLWPTQANFEQAYALTLEFFQNCRKHHLRIEPSNPKLYHAYHMEGGYPLNAMMDATQILRFGYSSDPEKDQQKKEFAALLAVAVKAHYFLMSTAIVAHEPFIFSIPDLLNPNQMRYGMIYPLEQNGKKSNLIITEWDLSKDSSQYVKLNHKQKFPVVLSTNPFDWLTLSKWKGLKKEAEEHPWFGNQREYIELMGKIKTHLDVGTFTYGHIIEYPIELNAEIKDVGGVFAPGIRKWIIPKGFNLEPITQYLDMLKSKTPQELYQLRWTQPKNYPR